MLCWIWYTENMDTLWVQIVITYFKFLDEQTPSASHSHKPGSLLLKVIRWYIIAKCSKTDSICGR